MTELPMYFWIFFVVSNVYFAADKPVQGWMFIVIAIVILMLRIAER